MSLQTKQEIQILKALQKKKKEASQHSHTLHSSLQRRCPPVVGAGSNQANVGQSLSSELLWHSALRVYL